MPRSRPAHTDDQHTFFPPIILSAASWINLGIIPTQLYQKISLTALVNPRRCLDRPRVPGGQNGATNAKTGAANAEIVFPRHAVDTMAIS